ncbi:Adenosine deaminase [Chionoecetes opilio]|uniref:adenosine deaminase n=1 Tax=Chionoecetes opilio TaxID=41210 RepID=A0A8J4YC20_CHIOP|nr:Adenosine deaminase [Chionoecetes opilio]
MYVVVFLHATYTPYSGDAALIERIAYEFIEDQARECVAYCEVRFTPQLLLPSHNLTPSEQETHLNGSFNEAKEMVVDDVLDAVLKGLARGEQQFGTKVRVILCCMRGRSGVRQGCVLAPSLFNTCMDWVLSKVVDQSDCGASLGNTKITDLVFADDAVIFAESLQVLVMALEALHVEAKPLGLEVSWLKTNWSRCVEAY